MSTRLIGEIHRRDGGYQDDRDQGEGSENRWRRTSCELDGSRENYEREVFELAGKFARRMRPAIGSQLEDSGIFKIPQFQSSKIILWG